MLRGQGKEDLEFLGTGGRVILAAAEGWSYRRIAKELKVSPGTVVNYVKAAPA